MKSHERPVPGVRSILSFGPLFAAALGCGPAVSQEVVVPAIPVTSTALPTADAPKPETRIEPPREVVSRDVPPEEAPAPKILRAADETDEPLDITDNYFVTGNSVSGGVPGGVRGGVVGGVPGGVVGGVPGGVPGGVVGGVPGGTVGGVVAGSHPSWTTPPRVKGPVKCSFPAEADEDHVDAARVILRVTVDPKGTASKVRILSDPGHGFGRQARMCAIGLAYDPPKDAKGAAIQGEFTLAIRFVR